IFHSPARTSSTPALAEAQFRKGVALRPERPAGYRNLGWTQAFQGRYAKAEIHVREFMTRTPRVPTHPGSRGCSTWTRASTGRRPPSSARLSGWSRASRGAFQPGEGPPAGGRGAQGEGAGGRGDDPGG